MTAYNLAIVWAPNILNRNEHNVSAVTAQKDTSAAIEVTLFLICNVHTIFHDLLPLEGNVPTKGNAFS
jgi:hypothetical protein